MSEHWRDQLGRFGVWRGAWQTTPAIAAGLELMGYGALWLGGSPDGDLLIVDELLDATSALVIGTSIVNIWKDDARTVAESFRRIEAGHPGRFILGVGAGHREATEQYTRPSEALAAYVDSLLAHAVPAGSIVLAALGPRMLTLAGERTAGAIPYLVSAEHTRQARELLGPGPLLLPEHKAVLDTDLARARALGRRRVRNPYLGLVNYTSNLRRLGFSDADLSGEGSDRLIDKLVALGGPEQVAAKLSEHLEAGADHVCVQLLAEADADPMAGYEQLALALGL
jgi:probable F420-dependent oxidoreductase